MTSVTNAQPY
uniref:Uncharacterized protein n=1 Tax=Anguilla anguilla TaxID=7936 RepID=A0A0E9VH08_ANGAN